MTQNLVRGLVKKPESFNYHTLTGVQTFTDLTLSMQEPSESFCLLFQLCLNNFLIPGRCCLSSEILKYTQPGSVGLANPIFRCSCLALRLVWIERWHCGAGQALFLSALSQITAGQWCKLEPTADLNASCKGDSINKRLRGRKQGKDAALEGVDGVSEEHGWLDLWGSCRPSRTVTMQLVCNPSWRWSGLVRRHLMSSFISIPPSWHSSMTVSWP